MSQTPAELWTVWRRTAVKDDGLLLFYGHGDRADDPWFSNFYEHSPFAFAIPPWCGVYGGRETVPIEFSEKAIMLCKASLMGDEKTFARVAAAQTPAEAKRLGRVVEPWDENRWQMHVCDIARHVALAKFAGVPGLRERLLATGERLMAEAAPNDSVWGIGLARKDPDARCPWKWKGANVLGWALMQAREELRAFEPPQERPRARHAGGAAAAARALGGSSLPQGDRETENVTLSKGALKKKKTKEKAERER